MCTAPDEILLHCHRAYANERPAGKRTGQLIANWCTDRMDLVSQCGINIITVKILYFMIFTFHEHLVGGDQIHHS